VSAVSSSAVVVLLAGCAIVPPVPAPSPVSSGPVAASSPVPSASGPAPTATGDASPSTAATSGAATPAATDSPAPSASTDAAPPPDTRKGAGLDQAYVVDGIPVISKDHPISRRYQRKHPGAHGLEREVADAIAAMTAAARKDGVKVLVRSGYRSYAEQEKILKRKIVEYGDEKLARRYNAEPGKSEHQTGLSADLWDGVTWGLGVRNTKVGKWLWKHSREYGFILRYPPGKEKITGYAYEPWHFRYIGVERSLEFKPNTSLTLEEYLGLA
jgi:D-alanyl-D-alanine carboxypeptidase